MSRRAKVAKPISRDYHVKVKYARSKLTKGRSPTFTHRLGQKREAIRFVRRCVRYAAIGTRGEVRTHEGALIYQVHRHKSGKLVAEEL